MSKLGRDYRVGMFASLGLLVLALLILNYGEEPSWLWTTTWNLSVFVDTPIGVEEGTPAFVQGVQVGRIKEIVLRDMKQPNLGAALIVEVEEHIEIPAQSTAKIHPKFGFDKGAIHIIPPAQKQPSLSQDGSAVIKGEMVQALASIVPEEYIPKLGEAVDEIAGMANRIALVSEDLHELLQIRKMVDVDDPTTDEQANIYTVVQRLDQTVKMLNQQLSEDEGDLRNTLASLRKAASDIEQFTNQLEPRTDALLSQTHATLATIQQRADELGDKMGASLSQTSRILDEIHRMAEAVNNQEGVLGKALYDAKLYEELVSTVESIELLVNDLRELKVWLQEESALRGILGG